MQSIKRNGVFIGGPRIPQGIEHVDWLFSHHRQLVIHNVSIKLQSDR